jgi:hypothetical protein
VDVKDGTDYSIFGWLDGKDGMDYSIFYGVCFGVKGIR